jgi:hypothetical protein
MGASIDGGWSGSVDTPRERRSEGRDAPEPDNHEGNSCYLPDLEAQEARNRKLLADGVLDDEDSTEQSVPESEAEEITDQSAAGLEDEEATEEPQVEVHPEDQGPLSDFERRSITESAKAFIEFFGRRLVAVAANHVLPVLGERVVDLAFELWDAMASIQALGSEDPVMKVPLPFPVPDLGFSMEIPLTSGKDGQTAPQLALCVGPDSPSLTGGWALDAGEDDDQRAQQPPAEATETKGALERLYAQRKPVARPIDTGHAADPEASIGRRPATVCLVEIDLDSLPLPKPRRVRAWAFAVLAAEYAAQLRNIPELRGFEAFIIADKERRCGLWVWRDTVLEIGRLDLRAESGHM